jgi:hypothetical protein
MPDREDFHTAFDDSGNERRGMANRGNHMSAGRLLAAVALALALLGVDLPAEANSEPDLQTALAVRVLAPPNPVHGADNKIHLAYELHVVNHSPVLIAIDSIKVLDPASGAMLQDLSGARVATITRFPGGTGATLPPSHSTYVFMDVMLPAGAAVPKEIVHRFEATRQLPRSPEDTHHGVPVTAESGVEPTETFTGVATPIGLPAVVISPPLKGPGWLAANGCCGAVTSHRGAVLAINGSVYVPERFAIDFVQLDKGMRLFSGPIDQLKSYAFFGAEILSATDGTVVTVVDGRPEQIPGSSAKGMTVNTAGGNHIVVDIGGGRFAFYAHLQPGSMRVKPGDKVTTGQVLARLGNTGNSDAPHLHFQVMDGPSPLKSNGLPYVFTKFTGQGVVTNEDPVYKGDLAPIDSAAMAGPHQNQLPLNNQIVSFD